MNKVVFTLLLFAFFSSCDHSDYPARILIFSKTAAYRHDCIETATEALKKLCSENGILAEVSENDALFNDADLKRYNAVVFLCTTGDILTPNQEVAFERYIQAGGGFVGIHSATDTEYGWGWYGDLVGAYFNGHPHNQDAVLKVIDNSHPSTKHLGSEWRRHDEWYNFKDFNPEVNILLNLDEKSYTGGTMGDNHPAAWYHEFDGGRAFYTAGGHTRESYSEPDFLKHLLGGIQYAVGKKKRLDYSACRTPEPPDPTRFVKTVVANELTEPMEMEMLPDGKVLFIERRGNIKLYDPSTGLVNVVYRLPVFSEEEDGLMGLALDPGYATNNWIYLYYSPVGDEPVNRLSRFVFRGDSLDRASEVEMLKVAVQREECCHTGGCIEFDGEGNLYLSTGDNTNPFASSGYAPIDERSGRSAWDAQKSSANTMDLRGKILRITPHPDGTYTCPKDNLFAQNPEKGRPEIYVMGCRNPFRISLDERRKLLFWGEVGPDAGEPDTARGPAGHDEVNRARAAGFFGWPYFVGNNKAYRDYDFTASKSGARFNPEAPMNESPNNTGSRELPPAQPAFIWYPYGNSPDFPLVGNGGRNAMAGPVYYCDKYPENTRFPDYYNGKLIIYEWMRGWMMAVTIDEAGNFSRMEPFADSLRFSRPMDMLVDKNGSIWVLEYGTQWFSSNPDARLSRIDYVRGNRPPVPILRVDKNADAAPLEAVFSAAESRDYDNEILEFELDFGDGTPKWSHKSRGKSVREAGIYVKKRHKNPLDSISHTYPQAGVYTARLSVRDGTNAFKTTTQKIRVGNAPPLVAWDFKGKNRSFYRSGDTLEYRLRVEDLEDGSLVSGGIQPASVATTLDYLETGFDITSIAQGHQAAMQQAEYAKGKSLIDKSDCKTCHAIDRKINGPDYQSIASRYKGDEFAVRNLSLKVIRGGAGVWGQTVMSAHPQLTEEDAAEMVRWILSLGETAKPKQSLAVQGKLPFAPKPKDKKTKPGTYILKATYKDRGSAVQTSLEGGEVLALRPAFQQAESADSLSKGVLTYRPFDGDTVVLRDLKHKSFVMFKHCDLTGVHGLGLGVGMSDRNNTCKGGMVEIRLDKPDGALVGQIAVPERQGSARMSFVELSIPLQVPQDGRFRDVYVVFKSPKSPGDPVGMLDWVRFEM